MAWRLPKALTRIALLTGFFFFASFAVPAAATAGIGSQNSGSNSSQPSSNEPANPAIDERTLRRLADIREWSPCKEGEDRIDAYGESIKLQSELDYIDARDALCEILRGSSSTDDLLAADDRFQDAMFNRGCPYLRECEGYDPRAAFEHYLERIRFGNSSQFEGTPFIDDQINEALNRIEDISGRNSVEERTYYLKLARTYEAVGRYIEANRLFVTAMSVSARLMKEEGADPRFAMTLKAFREFYARQGLILSDSQVNALANEQVWFTLAGLDYRLTRAEFLDRVELAETLFALGSDAKAQELFESIEFPRDEVDAFPWDLPASSRRQLARLYLRSGQLAKAEKLIARLRDGLANPSSRSSKDHLEIEALHGELLRRQGNNAAAQSKHLELLGYVGEKAENAPLRTGLIDGLAQIYLASGRIDEGGSLLESAVSEYVFAPETAPLEAVPAMESYANYLTSIDAPEEAIVVLDAIEKALARKLGAAHPKAIRAKLAIAEHSLNTGEFAAAEDHVKTAKEQIARTEWRGSWSDFADHDPLNTNDATRLLAKIYTATDRLGLADELVSERLNEVREYYGESDLVTLGFATQLTRIRLLQRDDSAIEPAELIVKGFEAPNMTLAYSGGSSARGAQANDPRNLSLFADAAWGTGEEPDSAQLAKVFDALQLSMVSEASDAVLKTAARARANASDNDLAQTVREREKQIAERDEAQITLARLLTLSGEQGAEERREAATARISALNSSIAQIDAQIKRSFPDYFAMLKPEALTASEVQSLLGPKEGALLIASTQFGTHIVAITDQAIQWHRSDLGAGQIQQLVNFLRYDVAASTPSFDDPREDIGNPRFSAAKPAPFDRATAFKLYSELFAPVSDTLNGKHELFIASSGAISTLPFAVLVTEKPSGDDSDPASLRNTAWLADRFAITNIPSIQSLRLGRKQPNMPARADGSVFLGVGDPVLEGEAVSRGARGNEGMNLASLMKRSNQRSGQTLADVEELRQLASLPGTRRELENIRAVLSAPASSVLLGEEATETSVRRYDLSRVNILAFATHGLIADPDSGLGESGLVLTPPATPSLQDDGYLSASEVAGLTLNADWVILSACDTATGQNNALSGLARSFLFAGAQNLLASHWPVDDNVASIITVRMLEILADTPETSRAKALHQAMREIRENTDQDGANASWAHPMFWAPFVLIGQSS